MFFHFRSRTDESVRQNMIGRDCTPTLYKIPCLKKRRLTAAYLHVCIIESIILTA